MNAEWHCLLRWKKIIIILCFTVPGMTEVAYGRGMKANSRVSETIL